MNWIERLHEIKGKDLYAQQGEGVILEYISSYLNVTNKIMFDYGGGDGFYLSNSRHLRNIGWTVTVIDLENGNRINLDNCTDWISMARDYSGKFVPKTPSIISMDTDGNDYWFLHKMLPHYKPEIVVAEFNAMYTDSRTIAYNPDHVWAGDSYYGFTFEAGKKLAEKHGYKVIFQTGDMNMFMVRADLIKGLTIPPVTYKQNDFFKLSDRTDWVFL
jgi:hypothetical protein